MSRRPIDISLSKDERSTLTTWAQANSTDQRLARRARIVMAAADGHSSAWISQELQVRRSTVSKWRNRFAARRIAALKDERRSGMPRIYDVAVEKRILKQLNEAPPRGYAVWNGRLVASVLGDVSADAVWRVLRRHRIDLRRYRPRSLSSREDAEGSRQTIQYGPKELAAAFRSVRENTIQIAEDIPETNYAFRVTPETRSVAETLSHVALATMFPHYVHAKRIRDMKTVSFDQLFNRVASKAAKLRSKRDIVAALAFEGHNFAAFIETLSYAVLGECVALLPQFGSSKTRFELLWFAKEHEIHHRAQLMVIERLLGIVPHMTRVLQQRVASVSHSTVAG